MENFVWNQEDYLLFLMLFIANSDSQITENERNIISNLASEKRFEKIAKYAKECNDIECIKIIADYRDKFFPGEEGKQLLISKMKEIANSDKNFNAITHVMVRNIQKLM